MRRQDLTSLQRPHTTVHYEGETFNVHPPSWDAYATLQNHAEKINAPDFNRTAEDVMQTAVIAVCATLRLDDVDNPNVSPEEAQMILMSTGMFESPILKAAFDMCGLKGQDDDSLEGQTDTPF